MQYSKKSTIYGLLGLTISWIAYAIYFIPQGLDLTDEGFVCSNIWRHSMGDLPFRDVHEIFISSIIVSPMMEIFPECGLYTLRICWGLVILVTILTGFLILSRTFRPSTAFWSMLCSLSIFSCYGPNIPYYKNIPIMFAVISIFLWIRSLSTSFSRKTIFYSILAGIAASIAALCKPPFLGMSGIVFISILSLFVIKIKERKFIWYLIILFTCGYIAGLAGFFLLTSYHGVTSDLFRNIAYARELPGYSSSIIKGLFNRGSGLVFLSFLPAAFFCFLTLLASFRPESKNRLFVVVRNSLQIWLIITVPLMFACFIYFTRLIFLYGYSYLLIIIGIVMFWPSKNWTEEKKRKGLVLIIVFMSAALLQFITTALSGNGVANSFRGMILSLPLTLVVSYKLLDFLKDKLKFKNMSVFHYHAVIIGIAIIICLFGLKHKWDHPYRDSADRASLNTPFKSSKLKGILSTPMHVAQIDKLLLAVSKKVKRGDYILVYENLPMLYFLTETRPFTRITWFCEQGISPSLVDATLEDMKMKKEKGHQPKIVIRAKYNVCFSDWPKEGPLTYNAKDSVFFNINRFIENNYIITETIGVFEILEPKDVVQHKIMS